MLILRLGWRNLWRNPRRSALSVGAVAVAYGVLVVLVGLYEGIAQQMLRSGTRLMLGHLQVHDTRYIPGRSLYDTIGGDAGTDVAALLRAVEAAPGVLAATPRAFAFGLLSTGERSQGAQLMGVDPAREARVTKLLEALVEGPGLAAAPANAILLGSTLAEELGAQVGDELAVVTQAADGTLGNDLLRVAGILRTGLAPLDRTLAVLALADLQRLLALDAGRIHEVTARLGDPWAAQGTAAGLGGALPPGARAAPWQRLAPELVDYLALVRGSNWFLVLILGLFAASGVLNTMLMAVFERTRELGLLAALGLRPAALVAMIAAESLWLGAVGLLAGLGLGALGTAYFAWHGWDLSRWLSGVTVAGVLFDPVLRAAWDWGVTARTGLLLWGLTVLAGLVPARRAARLAPVEALAAPVE